MYTYKYSLYNNKRSHQILEDELAVPEKGIYELRESIKAMERKVEIATLQKKQSDKQRSAVKLSPDCRQPALTRWRPVCYKVYTKMTETLHILYNWKTNFTY